MPLGFSIPSLFRPKREKLPQHTGEHTRIEAVLYTDEGFEGKIGIESTGPMRVTAFQSNKSFGAPAGKFTITIFPMEHSALQTWEDPEDVWVEVIVYNGSEKTRLFIGMIDSISETRTRKPDGASSVTLRLNCSDVGKVFATTSLYVNIFDRSGQIPIGTLLDPGELEQMGGTPDKIIREIFKAWVGNQGKIDKQWKMPSGIEGATSFYDYLQLKLDEVPGLIIDPSILSVDMDGATLWASMQKWCNGLMNELWVDIDPVTETPTLFLKERPFKYWSSGAATAPGVTKSEWEGRFLHELSLQDIQMRAITKGSPESRFNYWTIEGAGAPGKGFGIRGQIQFESPLGLGKPGAVPIFDADSIRKHGFRRWEKSTNALPFRDKSQLQDKGEELDPLRMGAKWLQRIHDWYVVAPMQLTGTITLSRMLPKIRIGDRIKEPQTEGPPITYYVEGVSHGYNYPQKGTTSLTLTHGEPEGADLLERVYARATRVETAKDLLLLDPESVFDAFIGQPPDIGEAVDPGKTQDQREVAGGAHDDTQQQGDKTVAEASQADAANDLAESEAETLPAQDPGDPGDDNETHKRADNSPKSPGGGHQ
jgi:hypothetical protein